MRQNKQKPSRQDVWRLRKNTYLTCTLSRHWRLFYKDIATSILYSKTKEMVPMWCSTCIMTNKRIKMMIAKIRDSIVVSISACHAEDPGSIPGRGILCATAFNTTMQTFLAIISWEEALPTIAMIRHLRYVAQIIDDFITLLLYGLRCHLSQTQKHMLAQNLTIANENKMICCAHIVPKLVVFFLQTCPP